MSAPVLWILLPILIGSLVPLLLSERTIAMTGGFTCVVLAGIALLVPIDEALRLGPLSLKIASSVSFLGRRLVLPATAAPLLAVLFGLSAFWFFGAESAGLARRLIPLGLIVIGLLVASIAVEPFLYAALLIEMAVLVAVPLLSPPTERPGRGVIRFLIYQSLGMPFILFAGWLLAGVETSPGDLSLTIQSTVMLGVGFGFLLAIFPLNDWMPRLMQECNPYATGFLIWLLPSVIIIFGMSFLDRYAWLRTSAEVVLGLRNIGLIMLVSSGFWSALEKHIGRIMAYAAIAETGFLLLAISLAAESNTPLIFWLLIPRGLGIATWALSISVFQSSGRRMDFLSMRGLARVYPWASLGLVVAALSTAGFPLLAGFSSRLGLWVGLAQVSTSAATWFFVGLLGLTIGALRQLALLVVPNDQGTWQALENPLQRWMLSAGVCGLLVLGIFPQAVEFIIGRLPLMFDHFSR